jgi:hypothetical protein
MCPQTVTGKTVGKTFSELGRFDVQRSALDVSVKLLSESKFGILSRN